MGLHARTEKSNVHCSRSYQKPKQEHTLYIAVPYPVVSQLSWLRERSRKRSAIGASISITAVCGSALSEVQNLSSSLSDIHKAPPSHSRGISGASIFSKHF